MTSEGLGEMFEGDSADMCAGKFPLVSIGGRAEGLVCADPGARTPLALVEIFNPFPEHLCSLKIYCLWIVLTRHITPLLNKHTKTLNSGSRVGVIFS